VKIPVLLVHGKNDDVVPPGIVKAIAERVFENLEYRLVEDDHSLHVTFPQMDWSALL